MNEKEKLEEQLLFKKMINTMKEFVSEKELIEFHLNEDGNNHTVRPIGYVKDVDSEYKNEFFNEIFENEDGVIIDVEYYKYGPSVSEMNQMEEYWIALAKTFNRQVTPILVVGGK